MFSIVFSGLKIIRCLGRGEVCTFVFDVITIFEIQMLEMTHFNYKD